MTQRKKLYLIDGSSYIFRAFYAIRQYLSTSKGLPTNALYGFANMLQKVVREEKPDYLAVCFDSKTKTFRHEKYDQYKANREVPPEDLQAQMPYFEPLVQAYNIATLQKDGFEADDIIGTLARKAEKEGLEVVIVSGDKDLMQLLGPHVHMLDTMKNKRFEPKDVKEKFGVSPEKVIEVLGLMGDSSDNVPGIKGVGPKTATDLIQKFGSIEDLYQNLDEIEKKKLQEKLESEKKKAFLSRELVTIDTGMDLDVSLENLQMKEVNKAELRKLYEEFEFKSLLSQIGEEAENETPPEAGKPRRAQGKHQYRAILTEEAFESLLKDLKSSKEFALDLETDSLYPVEAEPVGISFCHRAREAWYIPVGHDYLGAPDQLDRKEVFRKLKPVLENSKVAKIGHNIKYDLIVLKNQGVDLQGVSFDTMLASYVLDPGRRSHGLDDLAQEFLGHKNITYKDVTGTGSKQVGFGKVDIETATEYAAEDSDVTWRLYEKIEPQLDADARNLLDEIDLPLMEVLAEMELTGVYIDGKHLQDLSKAMEKKLHAYEKEIFKIAGEEFNINSPKQLSVILFEKLKLPVVKKTKTGYSTDVSVLEELAPDHELPEKILNYRQLGKLKSTYVDALPLEINEKTGRIHTSFNQTVTATGRLSSSDPNLQNIPIRSEMGREIRKAFVAEGTGRLLSADYSQIELRILAHLSEDEALVQAFRKGEDIHARTAAEIFGTPISKVTQEARRMAKAVNFGIVYGLSAYGLSRQLKIAPKEAKEFIDQYFQLYKGVKTYIEETIGRARKNGYTSTLMNRKRYLPEIHSKNRQIREGAERIAINSPLQGTASDLIKVAMIRLSEKLKKKKLKSKMILQVHDELLFECPVGEKKDMQSLVKKEMEGVAEFNVPLVVDMGWGKSWSDGH